MQFPLLDFQKFDAPGQLGQLLLFFERSSARSGRRRRAAAADTGDGCGDRSVIGRFRNGASLCEPVVITTCVIADVAVPFKNEGIRHDVVQKRSIVADQQDCPGVSHN